MSLPLLTIVQDVCLRCNISQPSVAFANPDPTIQQVIGYLQDAGDEYAERWTWRSLKRPLAGTPATITGDGTTTVFPFPQDWNRFSPSDTLTSSIHPTLTLRGPMNEDDLLRLKALPMVPSPSVWRLIGDASGLPQIEFFPALAAGEVVSYVYGSLHWITDASNVVLFPCRWTADTNLSLIHDRLLRLGAVWRWKKSKGLDYGEEFRSAELAFDRRAGQESTLREIRMSRLPVYGAPWWPGVIVDNTSHNY